MKTTVMKTTVKKTAIGMVAGLLLSAGIAQAVPHQISYQGKLLENGQPVTGTKSIVFTIGVWTETKSVSIENGLYSVTLGSQTPIPASAFDGDTATLQISVAGTALPTTAILSVPYAYKAESATDASKIAGKTVAVTAPASGQVLKWNGTQWEPQVDNSGGAPSGAASGDLSGNYPSPTVSKIAGKTVSTATPSIGQALKWSGTQWEPGAETDPTVVASVKDGVSWGELSGIPNYLRVGDGTSQGYVNIYSDLGNSLSFLTRAGSIFGEIGSEVTSGDGVKSWVFNLGNEVSRIRFDDDVYIGWPRSGDYWMARGELTVANHINAYGNIKLYRRNNAPDVPVTPTGSIYGNSDGISIWPDNPNGYGVHISGLFAEANGNGKYLRLGNYITFSEGSSWAGDLDMHLGSSDDKLLRVYGNLQVTGNASKPGGGSWLSSSDMRLKNIEANFNRGLNAITNLTPICYKYKSDNTYNLPSDKEYIGLIAQEVQAVIPEAVEEDQAGYLIVFFAYSALFCGHSLSLSTWVLSRKKGQKAQN